MVEFLPQIKEMKKDDDSLYLIALLYDENRKKNLKNAIKDNAFEGIYDELRIENSSWQKRRDYVQASNVIIFDKGRKNNGRGAVLSSTAYQTVCWGTPIIARNNSFFNPFFTGEIQKYDSDESFKEILNALLYNEIVISRTIERANKFSYAHSPCRTAAQFLEICNKLLNQGTLKRYSKNPILSPIKKHRWESKLVFNSAAIRINGKNYLAYRALGEDGISRIGLAVVSCDGYTIEKRLPHPIFEPEKYELPDSKILAERKKEKGGCEDPRMFILGNRIYMSYVLFQNTCKGMLASITIDNFLKHNWNTWEKHGMLFPDFDERGAVLFNYKDKNGKEYYGAYHRDTSTKTINFCSSEIFDCPFNSANDSIVLPLAEKGLWDDGNEGRLGTGSQVLKTEYGWLSFYHAHRIEEDSGERYYRLGIFLSDTNDPSKILYRSTVPVLSPETEYEKNGWVNNVVFTCGAVPKDKDSNSVLYGNDDIIIYYAGADNVLCAAEVKLDKILFI